MEKMELSPFLCYIISQRLQLRSFEASVDPKAEGLGSESIA